MAVGGAGSSSFSSLYRARPLAVRWNGTRWSALPVPARRRLAYSSELGDVSCRLGNRCEAVGFYKTRSNSRHEHALAERWNGKRWSVQKVAGPRLTGVACPTKKSCFAVGLGVLEHWNSKRWVIQRSRRVGEMDSVSCSSGNRCIAVGSDRIFLWNGRRWKMNGQGFGYDGGVSAVSCPSRTRCTAVGFGAAGSNDFSAWAAQWNGAEWTFNSDIPLPSDVAYGDWLNNIYCASSNACIAIGGDDGTQTAFVTTWNGHTWNSTPP
jgi:hypothetical protein